MRDSGFWLIWGFIHAEDTGVGGAMGLEIRPDTSYFTIFTISTTPDVFPWIPFIATPMVRRLTSVHTFTGTLTTGAAVPDPGGTPSHSHLKWVTVKQRRAPDAIFHLWCAGHTHPHFHTCCESQDPLQHQQRRRPAVRHNTTKFVFAITKETKSYAYKKLSRFLKKIQNTVWNLLYYTHE